MSEDIVHHDMTLSYAKANNLVFDKEIALGLKLTWDTDIERLLRHADIDRKALISLTKDLQNKLDKETECSADLLSKLNFISDHLLDLYEKNRIAGDIE